MSAATASSTDLVYVRLLDEGTDVWRPVSAQRLSQSTYKLSEEPIPEDEIWRFQPGDVVVVELKAGGSAVAVARASDFDELSRAIHSLAS